MTQFVSKPLVPEGESFDVSAMSHGEPSLPRSFTFGKERIEVRDVLATRRSYKDDRGDAYLKRHWFEFRTGDGRIATVYFDRGARRGAPRWWLYSLRDEMPE